MEVFDFVFVFNIGVLGVCMVYVNFVMEVFEKFSIFFLFVGWNIDCVFVVFVFVVLIDLVVYCVCDCMGYCCV